MSLRAWFKNHYHTAAGKSWIGFGAAITAKQIEILLCGRIFAWLWWQQKPVDRMDHPEFNEEMGDVVIDPKFQQRFTVREEFTTKAAMGEAAKEPEYKQPKLKRLELLDMIGDPDDYKAKIPTFFPFDAPPPPSQRLHCEYGVWYLPECPSLATHVLHGSVMRRIVRRFGASGVEYADGGVDESTVKYSQPGLWFKRVMKNSLDFPKSYPPATGTWLPGGLDASDVKLDECSKPTLPPYVDPAEVERWLASKSELYPLQQFYPVNQVKPIYTLRPTGRHFAKCLPEDATHVSLAVGRLVRIDRREGVTLLLSDKTRIDVADVDSSCWMAEKPMPADDWSQPFEDYRFIQRGIMVSAKNEKEVRHFSFQADEVYRRVKPSFATHILYEGAMYELDRDRSAKDEPVWDRVWGTDDRFVRRSGVLDKDWYLKIKDRHGARERPEATGTKQG